MKTYIYPSRIKASNLGDTLINMSLIRELSTHGKVVLDGNNPELLHLAQHNNPFKDNIKVISGYKLFYGLPVLRWINLLLIINKTTMVFDPPGHYSEGGNFNKFILKSLKYYFRVNILKFLKIKVSRIGITLGPFSNMGWNIQKNTFKTYHNVSVRDSNNYKLIQDKGIKNIKLISDLAFLYDSKIFTTNSVKPLEHDKYIVISFRGSIEGEHINEVYINNVCNRLIETITSKNFNSFKIIFSYQVYEDLEIIKLFYNKLIHFNLRCTLLDNQLNMEEATKLYSSAEFVFTNRLHVALISLLSKTPSLVITDMKNHHKLVNVYNDLGLADLIIDSKINVDNTSYFNTQEIYKSMEKFNHYSNNLSDRLKYDIKNIVVN